MSLSGLGAVGEPGLCRAGQNLLSVAQLRAAPAARARGPQAGVPSNPADRQKGRPRERCRWLSSKPLLDTFVLQPVWSRDQGVPSCLPPPTPKSCFGEHWCVCGGCLSSEPESGCVCVEGGDNCQPQLDLCCCGWICRQRLLYGIACRALFTPRYLALLSRCGPPQARGTGARSSGQWDKDIIGRKKEDETKTAGCGIQ